MHGFQMGFVVPGAPVVPWSFVGYQNHTGATSGTITWPSGTQVGDSALFLLLTEPGASPSMTGATQLRALATISSAAGGDKWAIWAVQSIASLAGPPSYSGLSATGGAVVAMTFRGMTLFTVKSGLDDTTAATMPLAGFTKDAACAQVLSCLVNRANSVPPSLAGPGTLLFKYAPTVYWVAAASSQAPAAYTNGANLTWLNYDTSFGASGVAIECTAGTTPTIPSCSIVPAIADITPTELETISTDNGTWAGYPYPSFTYQWWTVSPNAAISGATNSTYALTGTDIGTSLYCKVTGTNPSGSATAQSNTVGPVATAPPVNTVLPAISGSTVVGSTLTSTTGTWTGQPTITYAYQWKRGVTNVGTNQNTYVPVAGDVGSTITCQVTATNAGGSTSATSAATGTITQPVPVISVAPVVSGSLTSGSVLSCTTGTWTNSPSSYAYQWVRLPSTNVGTNSSSYTTVAGDETFNIKCQVTATNAGGSSSPADSNTVGPITAFAFTPADLPGLRGWYKADAGVTQSAGMVSQWNDQSGNTNHMYSPTAGQQPAYSATSFNGMSGITFDGVDDWILCGYFGAHDFTLGASNKMSVFMVVKSLAWHSGLRYVGYASTTGADYGSPGVIPIISSNVAADQIGGYWDGAMKDVRAVTLGTNYRMGSIFDGTNNTFYLNNVADGSPVAAATTNFYDPGWFAVGGVISGSTSAAENIVVAELVVTNTALNSTERNNLDTYFQNRWMVTPASIPGLRAWYKADAGVTTSSGNITAVADQSGNGFNLTQGGGNIPLNATGFNGKPCFDFVAANEGFLSCSTFAFPAADSSASVFAVVNINSNSEGDSGIVLFIGSGQTDDWNNTSSLAFLVRQGANNIQSFANTSELAISTGGLTAGTNYRMGLTWNASGNVGQHYVNNTAGTSDSATGLALNASAGKLLIGARQYGGSGVPSHADDFDGQIAEIVIFSGVLSATEREQLDTYFRWKWGL